MDFSTTKRKKIKKMKNYKKKKYSNIHKEMENIYTY